MESDSSLIRSAPVPKVNLALEMGGASLYMRINAALGATSRESNLPHVPHHIFRQARQAFGPDGNIKGHHARPAQ